MKKLSIILLLLLSTTSCMKDWLDREPRTILSDQQVWNDPKQIVALLANFYDRLPAESGLVDVNDNADGRLFQWRDMANFDDAMWSGQSNEDGRNNITSYNYNSWYLWNYTFIRDLNLAIENIAKYGVNLTAAQKKQYSAELRFLRAFNYFELVKRMGGVPLITSQLIYDYSGNVSNLQQPRAKESEVYDFIGNEVDAIKNDLGNDGSVSRANKYTALALKSRALLYAASIAKYNSLMAAPISTPGGEVGIPASMANNYYQQSLAASQEIINSGVYTLYKNNPDNGENFFEAVTKKASNKEVIFVKDYLLPTRKHVFSYDNIARGIREDNLGSSSVTPSLNLVESYEYLDGTNGALKIRTADNSDFIYYDNVQDIFANKDARLYGTIIYPGTTFKGLQLSIQAGVMVWNDTRNAYDVVEGSDLGTTYSDGKLLTGTSGPHRSIQEVSNTGFYLKKFIDPNDKTSTRGVQSDVWWVWFRLGEIYLNATEAAFELGQTGPALNYINTLRERAGFPANSVTVLTDERIRNERRVELAFEDHRLWDLKRWRIADKLWNGSSSGADAMIYALYPYRVIRPGNAHDGKYVFVKMVAPRFRAPRFFQLGNYYTAIDQSVLNNNPKIIKNPFH
ncbi:RagB/SusD family nutrient uptake outer membrane protein [Chitinophaga sancti]|uniref:RagB/SusD family nutrient uptake outer membrane protein n=1 Tax=Chitinophaga sancti TaxID=1004 RepID=A0A1K1MND3_9BACT|nr:RagB/SusD family nutrient uptake outer membrane protein [Chitinophaga sancti]WQD62834.1 RagB/SusD family nutrient uptake outer membrane protein [Chitinophaga sancti]WQG91542.1 RagB/SusD family nutrient uptake outer membrane protein [Chitinophaga sancti]SFW24663.1 Starch-binding associating with outer membrane [Chitinophaga sancti]